MAGAHAVRMAVRAYVEPNIARNLAAGPMPTHVIDVLKIAAGSSDKLDEWSKELNLPRERLMDIAVFFIEQVLMTREATHYRVLGVEPTASHGRLRNNYQWLIRWLHPDNPSSGWHSVLAQRVTAAYNELKDPQRREAYDATLQIPGTHQLRSTLPVEDDFFPEPAAPAPPPAAPPEPTQAAEPAALPETAEIPAPEAAPVEPPAPIPIPPAWQPEPYTAPPAWERPSRRQIGPFVAVAVVAVVVIIGLGFWLSGLKPGWLSSPATPAPQPARQQVASTPPSVQKPAPAQEASSEPKLGSTQQPQARPPTLTPAAPPAEKLPAPQQVAETAPAPTQVTPKAEPPTPAPQPAPAKEAPRVAQTQPASVRPTPAVTTARPAPATSGTTTEPAPRPTLVTAGVSPSASVATTPAPPPPAPEPAVPAEATALALRVGMAYGAGDFLTVLNLVQRGGRLSPTDLAATASGVQAWARERGEAPVSVAQQRPLQPTADGTEPRSDIALKTPDGATLDVVVRQVEGKWLVERVTPNAGTAGGAEPRS